MAIQLDGTTGISTTGNIIADGSLVVGSFNPSAISATGNVAGLNLNTNGNLSVGGNTIVAGDLTVVGNASLSGNIVGDKITNGTTSVEIQTPDGNANITIGGTSNVAVFSNTGAYITGVISANGNITGGNVNATSITGNIVSVTGNITGGNVLGGANVNATSLTGTTVSVSANVTSGNLLTSGLISATGNVTSGNVLTGGLISSSGNITGGNLNGTSVTGSVISASGNVTGGNIQFGSGVVTGTGNITGGNLNAAGLSLSSNVVSALNSTSNINTTGNITGGYIFGNGSQLTGIDATSIQNGNSNVRVVSAGGNVAINIGGTSNVAVFATTGVYLGAELSAPGNITGGNLITGGLISAGTTISGTTITGSTLSSTGNVKTVGIAGTGVFSTSGNIVGGNLNTDGILSTVGNIVTSGNITNVAGNSFIRFDNYGTYSANITMFQQNANGNIYVRIGESTTEGPGIFGLYATGTIGAIGNVTSVANIIQFGNSATWVLAKNVSSEGVITATGNVTAGNLNASGLSLSSNVLSALNSTSNITTSANVQANYFVGTFVGNISGNITAPGSNTQVIFNNNGNAAASSAFTFNSSSNVVSVFGNIIGNNILANSTISASGNIIGNAELYIGANATSTGLTNPIIVASATGLAYVQVAAKNTANTGSADLVTYADNGTDEQAWTDMGMTGSGFNDTAYTITDANDGYVFVQGNTDGTGGNLVLATGSLGTTADIVFATGGFLDANEKMRFVNATGQFWIKTATNATSTTTGALRVGGGAGIAGNIWTNGLITAAGNITGGNLSGTSITGSVVSASGTITGGNLATGGTASAGGNITGANVLTGGLISATGNITGNYILGNGSQLTGIDATSIQNGTSNVRVVSSGGNVAIGVGGTSNVAVFATTGEYITGLLSASGNVTGANISAVGRILVGSGNLASPSFGFSADGATDTGFYWISDGVIGVATNGADRGRFAADGLSVTGIVSATGNITGGNILGGANVNATTHTGTTVSVTGNITGGNILSGGLVNATSITGTTVSASGNVTGGNVNTNKIVGTGLTLVSTGDLTLSATGNINANNEYINNVPQPVQDGDAANKLYVDQAVTTGFTFHQPVFAATTTTLATATGGTVTYAQPNGAGNGIGATLTTTGSFNLIDTANIQTVGTRVLVKDQANAVQNGVYTWSNSTVIVRSSDTDQYGSDSTESFGLNDYFYVQSGNVNTGAAYIVNAPTGTITFGTSNITFAEFSKSQVYTANTSAGISLTGTVISALVDNVTTAFSSGNIVVKTGAVLTTPNIGAATGTSLSATGNVTGGNINTGGIVSATGNVTGNYILGNGALLTGVITSVANINNGTSNVTVVSSGGNVAVSVGGTPNVAVFATTGEYITGLLSVSGNITGGNLNAAGLSLSSNVVSAINSTSNIITTANITGGNILGGANVNATTHTGTTVSVTGNINGGNLIVTGVIVDNTGNLDLQTTATNGNINLTLNGTGNVYSGANLLVTGLISATSTVTGTSLLGSVVSVSANITGGNILTGGLISATSNITSAANVSGGNIISTGLVTATSNIVTTANVSGGNVLSSALIQGVTLSASGNVNGANITTAGSVSATGNLIGSNITTVGLISATGNITSAANIAGGNVIVGGGSGGNLTGANVISATTLSASANVIGGNITTAGLISATGNITGGNVLGGANVNATTHTGTTVSVTANVNGGNLISAALVQGVTVSASGNVNTVGIVGTGNISTTGNIFGGNVLGGANVNATTHTGTSVSITGTVTAATVNAAAIGNSGAAFTGASISAATIGNTSAVVNGATVSVTANITGGNILTAGNLTLSSTGQRILADFSNATVASRAMFQTSTANSATNIYIIPNGTSPDSTFTAVNNSDPTNAGIIQVIATSTDTRISSGRTGTGTYLPFTIQTSGTERFRIDTAGAITANVSLSVAGNITGASVVGGVMTGSSLSVSGAVTGGAITGSSLTVSTGNISGGNINNNNATGVGNIGTSTVTFNTVFAKATSAQYADLAESYAADADYQPGTVMSFGGVQEITRTTTVGDSRVAGVISTNPAHVMNAGLDAEHPIVLALTGRVPTSVVGTVRKGDMMISAGNGAAQACATPSMGTVIGKSLEDFDGKSGVIEIVVGRL
jgi:hypothetical protein